MDSWFINSSSPPRPPRPKGSSGRGIAPQTPLIHSTATLQPNLTTSTTSVLRRNPQLAKQPTQQTHSVSPTSNSASASTSTVSTSGTPSKPGSSSAKKNRHGSKMYTIRSGRRYIANPNVPYALPCDVPEWNRQNLRTVLLTTVFGAPFLSPLLHSKPPKNILDLGCGTGLWSSTCHDYLKHMGYPEAEFTGLDIVPVAPDLKEHGLNWRFVQHDMFHVPLPFPDESFDLVFIKDMNMALPPGGPESDGLVDVLRILRPGGVLEIWDTDSTIRNLLPQPAIPPSTPDRSLQQALKTGTYPLASGTGFSTSQNPFIQDYNKWITKALGDRGMSSLPCTTLSPMMLQEERLADCGNRRLVILLGEVRWEREGVGGRSIEARSPIDSGVVSSAKGKGRETVQAALTEEQMAVRSTAMLTFLQMVESLDPLLKEVSGKGQDEWDRWWAGFLASLNDPRGVSTGECMEIGSWWARKL